jgi:hypothetical protein
MSDKTFATLLKTIFALVVLLLGGSIWYYTMGRKPTLVLSVPMSDRAVVASGHPVGSGEMLVLSGGKATLYDIVAGAAKWTATLPQSNALAALEQPPAAPAAPAAPVSVPKKTAPPVKAAAAPSHESDSISLRKLPELDSGEKADKLVQKRVERRFAKLAEWSAKLNAKRATLKTQLQIEAFNEEAQKYHAELADARREAATLPKSAGSPAVAAVANVAASGTEHQIDERMFDRFESAFGETEVIPDGNTIVVLHDRSVLLLDRATGKTTKEVALSKPFRSALRGVGCVFAISAGSGGNRSVTRIATADGASQSIEIATPEGEAGYRFRGYGQASEPVVDAQRSALSANGSSLLEVNVKLLEKKITERQVIPADAPSSMEEADKKTTGGWGNDAVVFAQALAKDAAREETGGKERTDESRYEVTLTRPFETGIAPARLEVRGRADVFSTKSLDLVAAGRALIAFDHTNKKLWEAKLANPLQASASWRGGEGSPRFIEDGARLYFFDDNFLSAFDVASGQPAWRIPSAGIRKVLLDGPGTLYISSANGNDAPGGTGVPPVLLKVDTKQGKILWKLEKYEDCFVSGGQLYATRETRNSEDMVNAVFDRSKAIQCRWKLYKLSTRSGEPQWEWFQTRRPLHIETDGRKVALLFADELQLLKSIAL